MEIGNRELRMYAKPFLERFVKEYGKIGQFPRINIFTKQAGHVIVSIYPVTDKSYQGISIYEGTDIIDDPIERAKKSPTSWYVARTSNPDNWTPEQAESDLEEALETMRASGVLEVAG